jgi:hypothetical protein
VRVENDNQYEKIINQGLNTIGNKIWHPATTGSGKITAQSTPGIYHWHHGDTKSVENTTIITNMRKLMMSASQKRRTVRGTSMKRLDRSTFFFVAPHVTLYKKRYARSAWDRKIDKPPKQRTLSSARRGGRLS